MDKSSMLLFTALSFLASATPAFAQEQNFDMTDVIEDCCGRGISFASMGRNCSDMASLPDVPYAHRDACEAVFMSCCNDQAASSDCDLGILHRLDPELGDCNDFADDTCGMSHGKECCDCCGLGIEAYSLGIPCNHMQINTPCDYAFETCCLRTRQENDVNECTRSGRVLCEQKCINTIGSFKCGCRKRWRLNPDGYSCSFVTTPSVDPCSDVPCEHACQSIGNTYVCLCSRGYELAPDEFSCRDIDECSTLVDPCQANEQCYNQPGAFVCRPARGRYTCPRGLRYSRQARTCEDVDECTEGSHNCNRATETCYNIFKGFQCIPRTGSCPRGYRPNRVTSQCVDINECAQGNPCEVGQRCENSDGAYRCVRASDCGTGYTLSSITQQCEDINECAQNDGNCGAGFRCENLEGSFRCVRAITCGTGYTLHSVTQECEDVNECTEGLARCRRNQRCVNLLGSHSCESCDQGYRVDSRNECTIDVDECAERQGTCTVHQRCVNTQGSYRCDCLNGYEFDPVRNDCFDIDECNPADGSDPCLPHQHCYNLPGEYDCQNMCSYGARYTRGTCVDINECTEGTHQCNEMQECVNQEGGHLCRCPVGYRLTRSTRGCEDIDECTAMPNSCRGDCENTDGSFRCTCPDGYTLNDNGFSCNDINECTLRQDDCDSDQECFNTLGGYKCRSMECPEYYDRRLAGNQRECKLNTERCPPGDTSCINNPTTQYSFMQMALPSIPYISSPIRLMTMDIGKSSMSDIRLSLLGGNERNYFTVQKRTVSPVHVRASVLLIQAVQGPYETDLQLEVRTIVRGRTVQQTIVVIHIDFGANLW